MNRLLSFLDIRHSERSGTLQLFFITALFSISASIGRSIGMTLLVGHAGEAILPSMFMVVDVCVMFGSVVYASLTRTHTSSAILGYFLLAFILLNGLFAGLFYISSAWVFSTFFVLFSTLQILIFVHLSSFIASYFSAIQLRRLFPVILAGISIGGSVGGGVIIGSSLCLSPERMQWLVALPCILAWLMLHRLKRNLSPIIQLQHTRSNLLDDLRNSGRFIRHSALMFWLSLSFIFFVLASRLLEFEYQGIIYPQQFPDLQQRTAFFGRYELFANVAGLLTQLIVMRWLLTRTGVASSNLIYPLLTLCVSLGLLIHPSFLLGIVAHFVNQELRQAIRSPACNLLFNAIPDQFWGGCKAYLHGLVFPLSTIAAACLILVLQAYLPTEQLSFALSLGALVCSMGGLSVALYLGTAYRRGVFERLSQTPLNYGQDKMEPETKIQAMMHSQQPQQQLLALDMIVSLQAESCVYQVGKTLVQSRSTQVKIACADTLSRFPNTHISATYLLRALRFERHPDIVEKILKNLQAFPQTDLAQTVRPFLWHPNPHVFVRAFRCAYENVHFTDKMSLQTQFLLRFSTAKAAQQHILIPGFYAFPRATAQAHLQTTIDTTSGPLQAQALDILLHQQATLAVTYYPHLIALIKQQDPTAQHAGLTHLLDVPQIQHWPLIMDSLKSPHSNIQQAATELIRYHIADVRDVLFAHLLQSHHESLCQHILSVLFSTLSRAEKQTLWQTAEQHFSRYGETLVSLSHTDKRDDQYGVLQNRQKHALGFYLLTLLYQTQGEPMGYQDLLIGLLSTDKSVLGNALEALSQLPKHPKQQRLMTIFETYVLHQAYAQAHHAITH